MTPEKARELRDLSSPGPWIIGRHKYADAHRIYDRRGNLIAWGARGFNADLMAAARDLARIVAGLRFMYGVAVEMPHGTGYLAEDIDGDIWVHSDPHFPAVMWFGWDKDAEDVAYFWNRDHPEHATARVVRRLVGEPEVVE